MKSKIGYLLIILTLILGGCINTTNTLKSIELSPTQITLHPGETQEFLAIGKDQNGNVIKFNPSWTLSSNIGTLSSTTGSTTTFTATSPGKATLTVSSGVLSASASITIVENNVLTSLSITPSSVRIGLNQTQEFQVVGKDQYGNEIEINPTWVVTGEIGTVNPESGVCTTFTATAAGTGTLTASVGDISCSVEITVESPVEFADPNLEAVIREELQKFEGPLYPFELESLYSLSADEKKDF
ncbi:hypothetical protein BBF96_07460 [Anoxybacter fermentans]|uniref:BIG2 domain-containing protein n=1 Tax=Anoxybacter fermentans TaxID=1323375 RepID=A0A3Q9HQK0_9FIRM|nr:hypothetical protein [Anoxybacter fermentans]AZR73235.1 hypothetical protein BBF96_07460 [Anoxybacter fermentans]